MLCIVCFQVTWDSSWSPAETTDEDYNDDYLYSFTPVQQHPTLVPRMSVLYQTVAENKEFMGQLQTVFSEILSILRRNVIMSPK